jgi:Phage integrase, N-terminal SAM-like domain
VWVIGKEIPVTRLRKMMLEELQRRNYSAITTRNYLRVVSDFAKHFGKSPDKLDPNELRTYQAYPLTEMQADAWHGSQPGSSNDANDALSRSGAL